MKLLCMCNLFLYFIYKCNHNFTNHTSSTWNPMNNLCVVTNTERATKTFMLNDWFLWKRPERKESYWRCNIKEFETFSVNDNWFPWLKILCDIHIVSTSQMQSKETDFFLSRLQPGCEIRVSILQGYARWRQGFRTHLQGQNAILQTYWLCG